MSYPIISLRPGKQTSAAYRHPWIFSGAVAKKPDGLEHGSLVSVVGDKGNFVGVGTYSSHSSIAIRLFEFGDAVIDEAWFAVKFAAADARRRLLCLGPGTLTDGYRVVFGEADGVPGLVVDRYGKTLVIQISTAGMDKLKDTAVAALIKTFSPDVIVERSEGASRQEEGLEPSSGLLAGESSGPAAFLEDGMRFSADVLEGQKTGFFLDQRELRRAVSPLAGGKRALNLFSYSGAAGIAAIRGGAISVHNVDSSADALAACGAHAAANGIAEDAFTTEQADIFQFLGAHLEPEYDLVIMDPPALIKSRRDVEEGKKAYHFLNRAAMRLVKNGGVFVTSSCSHYLPEEDFTYLLRRASVQNGIVLSTLAATRQAADHPVSVYFPESAYLKSFAFEVRRA